MISKHLRVPMGLVVDNTRDFIMDDSLGDNKIEQTQDDTMDYLYESMIYQKKMNKTKKKRR